MVSTLSTWWSRRVSASFWKLSHSTLLELFFSTVNQNPFETLCDPVAQRSPSYFIYRKLPLMAFHKEVTATALLVCAVSKLFLFLRHSGSDGITLIASRYAYCCVTPFFSSRFWFSPCHGWRRWPSYASAVYIQNVEFFWSPCGFLNRMDLFSSIPLGGAADVLLCRLNL